MKSIEMKNNECTLTESPIPTVVQDEILIQVAYAGINRPDLLQSKGLYPPPKGASPILGLEVAGTVIKGNQDFKEGTQVCALVSGGGYAEFVNAPAGQCLPVPKGWSLQEAACLPETLFTVWANIGHLLEKGKKLLVHGGSSGIGSTAIQMAKLFGLEVATTVRTQGKAEYCKELGADLVILYENSDFQSVIEQEWGQNSVDIVLDMVGGDYFPKNLKLLAKNGTHVTIAMLNGKDSTIDLRDVLTKHLTITGSTLRSRSVLEKTVLRDGINNRLMPFLDKGHLKPSIEKEFPLADAGKALEMLEKSAHKGKIVLKT